MILIWTLRLLPIRLVIVRCRAIMTNAEFDAFQTGYNALVDLLNTNEEMHRELIRFNGLATAKIDDAQKIIQSKVNERAALQLEVEKQTAGPAIERAKLVSFRLIDFDRLKFMYLVVIRPGYDGGRDQTVV